MTLWIGNGALLKSSSQWQLNEFGKLNNSGHELFNFHISFNCQRLELLRTAPLPLIATFQMPCAASLNLGRSQKCV